MFVLDNQGNKLFAGSRHACKQFIRKNKIKRFQLKERFVEKNIAPLALNEPPVIEVEEVEVEYPEEVAPMNDPETPEGLFNRIFHK